MLLIYCNIFLMSTSLKSQWFLKNVFMFSCFFPYPHIFFFINFHWILNTFIIYIFQHFLNFLIYFHLIFPYPMQLLCNISSSLYLMSSLLMQLNIQRNPTSILIAHQCISFSTIKFSINKNAFVFIHDEFINPLHWFSK